MKITVISAHPDDMEIACAGTLLTLQNQGHEITNVITVCPSKEHNTQRDQNIVQNELNASIALSGFTTLIFKTDLHDNGRPNLVVDNNTMSRLGELLEPCDLAIIPNRSDYHQDHRNTHDLVWPLMLKRARSIFFMHSWPYCLHSKDVPTVYKDITSTWDQKQQLLECYGSYFIGNEIEQIKLLNKQWGYVNHTNMAEAFTVGLIRA